MHSMTGFGRGMATGPLGRVTVELATLNSRYLELSVRLPKPLVALEPVIRQQVAEALQRGKVTVSVGLDSRQAAERVKLDANMARAYMSQLRTLRKELKIDAEPTLTDLLQIPDILAPREIEPGDESTEKQLAEALSKALAQLAKMREKEGQAMAADMKKRLLLMQKSVEMIEKRAKQSVQDRLTKLRERVQELLAIPMENPDRLDQELAIMADKGDITEECVRFRSHLVQFRDALSVKEPIGKRLNFILQEMNREANTMGSKAVDISLTQHVILIKEELEKIREMVQNIE